MIPALPCVKLPIDRTDFSSTMVASTSSVHIVIVSVEYDNPRRRPECPWPVSQVLRLVRNMAGREDRRTSVVDVHSDMKVFFTTTLVYSFICKWCSYSSSSSAKNSELRIWCVLGMSNLAPSASFWYCVLPFVVEEMV